MTTAAPARAHDPGTETVTLTRILLNRNNPSVRRDLADATELHKTLMRLIPDDLGPRPREQAGLLFRLQPDTDQPTLLIQARLPPLLDRLPATYGTVHTRSMTRMLRALTRGMNVRYRITANPSKRDARSRQHVPLYGKAALDWWQHRATQAGLRLHRTDAERRRFLDRKWQSGEPFHALTQFDGTATVTDAELLAHAVLTGIGRGKAYGAGLLSLMPSP